MGREQRCAESSDMKRVEIVKKSKECEASRSVKTRDVKRVEK